MLRRSLFAALSLAGLFAWHAAWAQNYPVRPVRVIVGFGNTLHLAGELFNARTDFVDPAATDVIERRGMQGKIRRVISGHDAAGKAVVLSDGLAPAVRTNPLRPGHISVDLWKTASAPVVLGREEPDPTLGPKQLHPAPRGTVFRISEIAPESDAIRNLAPEQAREVFRAMGNEHASTAGASGRHPFMHRTETVDYAVVLQGEITLLLDEEDVHLKAGDVVIQRGTNHAWSNRSDRPCLMLYVLIDGEFDAELAALLR